MRSVRYSPMASATVGRFLSVMVVDSAFGLKVVMREESLETLRGDRNERLLAEFSFPQEIEVGLVEPHGRGGSDEIKNQRQLCVVSNSIKSEAFQDAFVAGLRATVRC